MRWWVVAAGVLALASCSDGDGETAVAEAGTVPPTAPERAPEPTVATTTPPAPATEPSVTSTTTSPPTTAAPPTTVDPATALAEQVEADYLEGWRLLRAAQQKPADSQAADAALSYVGGSSRRAARESLEELLESGMRILPDPPVPARIDIENDPELLADGTARMQACVIDPWVLVETGAGPDGSDAIVDDNIYAYRNTVTLKRIDGLWKVTESVEIGRWVGESSCEPS